MIGLFDTWPHPDAMQCGVCGCNNRQCDACELKNNGEPCHWITETLCSVCYKEIEEQKLNNPLTTNQMSDFFKKLLTQSIGLQKVTLVVVPDGAGGASVTIIPERDKSGIKELVKANTVAGTAEELDEGFFGIYKKEPITEGLIVAPVKEDHEEEETEEETPKSPKGDLKGKTASKPVAKSKTPVKKAAAKAAPTKKAVKPAAKKKTAAPATGPNSEGDKHHQADLEENLVEETETEEQNGEDFPTVANALDKIDTAEATTEVVIEKGSSIGATITEQPNGQFAETFF